MQLSKLQYSTKKEEQKFGQYVGMLVNLCNDENHQAKSLDAKEVQLGIHVLTEEAQAFLNAQPFKAQQKIYYNIFKVEEGVMKVDIFKKLENTEIWEFRTLYNGICYRLFSFWDTEEETLVIATHGIVKKTQKTPLKEIAKAEELRKEYFNNKKK